MAARATIRFAIPQTGDIDEAKRRALLRMAQHAMSMITRRTAKGIDSHGRPFKPYSKQYLKAKTEAGRNPGVDLTLSGQMLRAVAVKEVGPKVARLGFKPSRRQQVAIVAKTWKAVENKTFGKKRGSKFLEREVVDTRAVKRTGGDDSLTNDELARIQHRLRRWFEIVSPQEKAALLAIGKREFAKAAREINARNRQKVGR